MANLKKAPTRTSTAFGFSVVNRSILEGFALKNFDKSQREAVLKYFSDNPTQCVYCGNENVQRWDHLIPIRRGGDTVIGNMVPACSACDDSKQEFGFEEWMIGSSPLSPKTRGARDIEQRILRIKAYMHDFDYQPKTLEERLDAEEFAQLIKIQEQLTTIRKELDTLIEKYRKRVGNQ
jgi:hypothetical protein